jgi:hypothetical protein
MLNSSRYPPSKPPLITQAAQYLSSAAAEGSPLGRMVRHLFAAPREFVELAS